MNPGETFFILSLSISLPIIICICIYHTIDTVQYPVWPLLCCMVLSLAMEVAGYCFRFTKEINLVYNIYALAEFLLLRVQLYLWTSRDKRGFPVLDIAVLLLSWLLLVFYCNSMFVKNSYFHLLYYFAMVTFSLKMIHKVIFDVALPAKKFLLIISISLAAYYTYSIIVEIICKNYQLVSDSFIIYVFYIKSIANLIFNIMLAIGLLCIPKKQQYTVSF